MKSSLGWMYVGFDGTGLFKIGITNDYAKRMKQIRTGNPSFQYLLCFEVENPAIAEVEAHTRFETKRFSGEWFKLEPEDLKWIYDKYAGKDHVTLEEIEYVHDGIVNKKLAMNQVAREYIEEHRNDPGNTFTRYA